MGSVHALSLSWCLIVVSLITPAAIAHGGDADSVSQGAVYITDPADGSPSQLPLQHTEVQIEISGTVAEVEVRQRFGNPHQQLLEALYVFPLPDRAAVDDMSIQVGDRRIRGEIHRRQEARRLYDEAVAEGRLAGLLDQERPNIFSQRVANILPGERIEVVIHYVQDLHFDHGRWQLVFPMVVGPRYIPGGAVGRRGGGWSPDTDQVPDASLITPPVLPPGQRSGHDIALAVELRPGFDIRELASPSHELIVDRRGARAARIGLAPRDTIPNKDFVLSWSTAAAQVESTVVAHKLGAEGYLSLIVQPPAVPRAEQVVPREVVFVLDSSGSMSGEPMAACKQLVRKALMRLRADDSFRLIRFAGHADQLAADALPAQPDNIERAMSYLDGMRGGGGTEMLAGVRAALGAPRDPGRLRMVLFLTDGYIGNEAAILAGVSEQLGDTRIFSLGVGSSVNRYLLDRLAEAGRGVAEYLRPGESPDHLVDRFYARISDPVFTELEIDWGGLEVFDVEPRLLPDLFAGQPLLLHARYRHGQRGVVTLHGFAGSERHELRTRVHLPRRQAGNASQAQLWARARIARLEMDRLRSPQDAADISEEITLIALDHRLMTATTSFVAIDDSTTRDGGELVSVQQPVPMPEGVSHEGVFGRGPVAAAGRTAMEEARARPQMAWIPDPTPAEPLPIAKQATAKIELDSERQVKTLVQGVVGVPPVPRRLPGGEATASQPPATAPRAPTPPQIPLISLRELSRLALSCFLLLFLLSSGAWLLRRSCA